MSSLPTKAEIKEIVADSLVDAFVPGKVIQDYFIQTDLNKKYDIYSYDPRKTLFSPLDFLPFGALYKVGKGATAVSRGRQLTSMGFSGFGRAKVKEGAVGIFTAVASKMVGSYRPGTSGKSTRMSPGAPVYDQSRVDSSLTSKSKTRGKKRSKRLANKLYSDWYIPMSGQKCKPGYYRVGNMCVKD